MPHQLIEYLLNDLQETVKLAHKHLHNSETASIHVHNHDILMVIDKHLSVILYPSTSLLRLMLLNMLRFCQEECIGLVFVVTSTVPSSANPELRLSSRLHD